MSANLRHSISGYASTWHQVDLNRVCFEDGAFSQQMLEKFIAGPAPLLLCHNDSERIGRIISAVSDLKGLLVTAEFLDTPMARDFQPKIFETLAQDMDVGLSIKCNALETRQRCSDGVRQILSADLLEVSVMLGSRPANQFCRISGWKSYPAPPPTPTAPTAPTPTRYPAPRPIQSALAGIDPEWENKKKLWPPGMQTLDGPNGRLRSK